MNFWKHPSLRGLAIVALGAAFATSLHAQSAREAYRRDSLFLEATSLYITDRPQQALDVYRALLQMDPGNATAAYQISNILADNSKFSDAIIYAEKACLEEPENEWFQLLRGQLYKTSRQFKKAIEVFSLLFDQHPQKLDYAYERANMAVMAGDFAQAIAIYDNLQKKYGFRDDWSMQKYKLYSGLNNTKAARNEIKEISAAMPTQTKYLEILAQLCMKEKDYKQAYHYFKKILELKPNDPYIHVSLADYHQKTKNFSAAFHSLENAVANPQLDFKTKVSVIEAYSNEEKNEKPEETAAQLVKLYEVLNHIHPDQAEGLFAQAKLLFNLEQTDEAKRLLTRAIALDSNVFSSWELLLLTAYRDMDTALMERVGREACDRFPEQASPYMYRAVAAFLDDRYSPAVNFALQGLRYNMGGVPFVEKVLLQILGDACFELKRYDESLDAYERLFVSDPEDRYVRNNYAYYLALIGRDLAKAEAMADKLCREEPQNGTFLDTYAWVLYRVGKYAKALEYVEKALKNGASKDATVWEHMGDILHRLGKTEQAVDAWKKALNMPGCKNQTELEQKIKTKEIDD